MIVEQENYQRYDGMIKTKSKGSQRDLVSNPNSNRGDTSMSSQGDSSRCKQETATNKNELMLSFKDKNNRTNKYIIEDTDFLEDAPLQHSNEKPAEAKAKVWPLVQQEDLSEEEKKQQEINAMIQCKYKFPNAN